LVKLYTPLISTEGNILAVNRNSYNVLTLTNRNSDTTIKSVGKLIIEGNEIQANSNIDLNNKRIKNVPTLPVSNTDAVNKQYVDNRLSGSVKQFWRQSGSITWNGQLLTDDIPYINLTSNDNCYMTMLYLNVYFPFTLLFSNTATIKSEAIIPGTSYTFPYKATWTVAQQGQTAPAGTSLSQVLHTPLNIDGRLVNNHGPAKFYIFPSFFPAFCEITYELWIYKLN